MLRYTEYQKPRKMTVTLGFCQKTISIIIACFNTDPFEEIS